MPDGIFIIKSSLCLLIDIAGENITFVNMIFSNLGDYLAVRNNRYMAMCSGVKWSTNLLLILEYKQLVIFYQRK